MLRCRTFRRPGPPARLVPHSGCQSGSQNDTPPVPVMTSAFSGFIQAPDAALADGDGSSGQRVRQRRAPTHGAAFDEAMSAIVQVVRPRALVTGNTRPEGPEATKFPPVTPLPPKHPSPMPDPRGAQGRNAVELSPLTEPMPSGPARGQVRSPGDSPKAKEDSARRYFPSSPTSSHSLAGEGNPGRGGRRGLAGLPGADAPGSSLACLVPAERTGLQEIGSL